MLTVPVILKAISNKNLLKLLYCLGKLAFEMKEQVVEGMMVFEWDQMLKMDLVLADLVILKKNLKKC